MKIVQIGTGGWGKNHTRILSELGVLVAICDAAVSYTHLTLPTTPYV